jgi:glycerate kinase
MSTILIACDKFKGSVTAEEACNALARGISSVKNEVVCLRHPMADGGEGSLSVLQGNIPLQIKTITVQGPLGKPIQAAYAIMDHKAYIETAAACGLHWVSEPFRDPGKTTTFGVGMLIQDALLQGCIEIHLFLGGSATNDGGVGMAAALGYAFLRHDGSTFLPTGETLSEIISWKGSPGKLFHQSVRFYAWCDVDIPLLGPKGAVMLFAAQKGATQDTLPVLEEGMRHLSTVFASMSISNYNDLAPGAGAAGGLGAGCMFFLGATLKRGTDFIIQTTELIPKIKSADLVITGEGSLDAQSLHGKVVTAIAKLCMELNKPCVVVTGRSELRQEEIASLGLKKVLTITSDRITISEAISNAVTLLENAGAEIATLVD